MLKIKKWSRLFAFAATLLFCGCNKKPSPTQPLHLNLCSYNIGQYNYGNHCGYEGNDIDDRINDVKSFLADNGYDILCLQENTPYIDREQTISSRTRILARAYLYNEYGRCNTSISSNYPLYSVHTDYFKAGYNGSKNGYIKADTIIAGKEITLLCCHLSWRPEAAETRKAQMLEIAALCEKSKRVMLFGDWNVADTSEYSTLTDAGYRSVNGGYLPYERTYNYSQDYSAAADKSEDRYFDNILIKGNFTGFFEAHEEEYKHLMSDHLPVSAEINIK